MLEQRRAEQKGYITLREAAKITGYTPDYVGQLVRAGKIKGEQVYSGVAWMITEEDIQDFLLNKGKVGTQSNVYGLLEHQYFRYVLYLLIALCTLTLLFLQYIFYISIDSSLEQSYITKNDIQRMESS